jgi:hypothetical protein
MRQLNTKGLKMTFSKSLLFSFLSILAFSTNAQVVATCGTSSGYSYYVEGGYVEKSKAGFSEDGISSGSIQLVINGDDADIIVIDATNTSKSAKEQGGTVVAVKNGSNIGVAIFYEGVIENYVFRIDTSEVTFSKATFGYMLDKHSVFKAACVFE